MSNITIRCPRCGSTEFTVPRKDLRLNDRIACTRCKHSDTYERIAGPVARKYAEDELKKALRGINLNINIKI